MAARRSKGKGGDENRSVTPDHPGRDSSPRSRKCLDMTLKGSRVCIQCCGSVDVYPGSDFFPSRIRIKKFEYFNPKTWKYDPDCSSRIRILIFYSSWGQRLKRRRIPDPESGSATLRAFIQMSNWTIFLSSVVFIRIRLHWHHCAGSASRPWISRLL